MRITRSVRRSLCLAAAGILGPTGLAGAQQAATSAAPSPSEVRYLDPADEVVLALSAGPSTIWDDASAYVLTPSRYELTRQGGNGFRCLVLRAAANPEVVAPACFDAVASRYVLPVELEKGRLIAEGLDAEAIEASVREGFAAGRFEPPPETAIAYMFSAGQRLGSIGQWKPHVMIYAPGRTNPSIGGDPEDTAFPFIAFEEGREHATIIIPTETFVSPEDVAREIGLDAGTDVRSDAARDGESGVGFEVGLPPLMEAKEEVRLARSAAPAEQSAKASVLVLKRGGYEVASEGDNGWTCYVSRSRIVSVEPICYDPEASRTILPIRLRTVELVEQGVPVTEARERVAEEIRDGKYDAPTKQAMAFMMSSGQVLYGADGRRAGAWKPHMHVFMPWTTAEDLSLGEAGNIGGVVTMIDSGDLTASLVVVLPEFIDPGEAP